MQQVFAVADIAAATGSDDVEHLGTGAFGETWVVGGNDGVTAKKLIHRAGYDAERLAREVAGLRRVDSPHVVRLLDVGELDVAGQRVPCLTFEFVPGGDLASRLATAPLAPVEAEAAAGGLLQGLVALHAAQTVHRDVKPANVALRDGDPRQPVLLDLGLAKLLDVDSITKYPTMIGTAMYAAPEQLRGERAGRSADMWALGVVLHEAVAGTHPFFLDGERLTLPEALNRLAAPPALPASVPPSLAGLIGRCLDVRPHRRGSARAALRRLQEETT